MLDTRSQKTQLLCNEKQEVMSSSVENPSMSCESSFAVGPSDVSKNVVTSAEQEISKTITKQEVPTEKESSASPKSEQSTLEAIQQPELIPGTLIVRDWMLPSHNLRRRNVKSIRALPFEPLAHLRRLPKSGTISPLLVREHGTAPIPHRIPLTSSSTTSGGSETPPITEIRIPTPAPKDDDGSQELDYQTLYLCCQRDLHQTVQQKMDLHEENRMLKRQLIQMQKQLYASARTRKTGVSWSVPVSTFKRQRTEG